MTDNQELSPPLVMGKDPGDGVDDPDGNGSEAVVANFGWPTALFDVQFCSLERTGVVKHDTSGPTAWEEPTRESAFMSIATSSTGPTLV